MFDTLKHRWNLVKNLSQVLHDFSSRLKLLEKRHEYLLRHSNRQIRRRWARQVEKEIHFEHIVLGRSGTCSCARCSPHKKHLRIKTMGADNIDKAHSTRS